MINIIYNNSIFDSILAKEIFKNFCDTNNLEYTEILIENINNITSINNVLEDKYFIFGIDPTNDFIKLLKIIKNNDVRIFECNKYNIKYINLNKNLTKLNIIYHLNSCLSLTLYNYLYSSNNLLPLNNTILNDISNYLMCNYTIENDLDLATKYSLILKKYNKNNEYINTIINNLLNINNSEVIGQYKLYTTSEYNKVMNALSIETELGFNKKNMYIINSDNIISYKSIENKFIDNDYVIIYNKYNSNTSYLKIFFKEKESNFEQISLDNLENNKYYTIYNTKTNNYGVIYKYENNIYKYVKTLSNNTYKTKFNLTEDHVIYDIAYNDIIEFNKFNAFTWLNNNFLNADGNKHISSTTINDEKLFTFLKNPKI